MEKNPLEYTCLVCQQTYENEIFYKELDKCTKDPVVLQRLQDMSNDVRHYQTELTRNQRSKDKVAESYKEETKRTVDLLIREQVITANKKSLLKTVLIDLQLLVKKIQNEI